MPSINVPDPRDPNGEKQLEVDYSMSGGRAQTYWEPEEPPELCINGVYEIPPDGNTPKDAPDISQDLSADDFDKIDSFIYENHEEDDSGPDFDDY